MSFSVHITADCLPPTPPPKHPRPVPKSQAWLKMNEHYYIILHKQFVHCNHRERGSQEEEDMGALITFNRLGKGGCYARNPGHVSVELWASFIKDVLTSKQVLWLNRDICRSGSWGSGISETRACLKLAISNRLMFGDADNWPLYIQFSPSQTAITFIWECIRSYVYSWGLCRTVMSESLWQWPLADTLTDVSLTAAALRDVVSLYNSHCCGNVSTASTSFTSFFLMTSLVE